MFTEDQFIAISALQHWLFCPRQCALIHLEQVWAENRFTTEGQIMHQKAHEGPDETRSQVRVTRGMPVASQTLGLSGQCDVVEFHSPKGDLKSQISNFISDSLKSEISNLKFTRSVTRVVPVEYKRGKPKGHRADEVQLCAQAMCLEEMLGLEPGAIDRGYLFYGQHRRRFDVFLDQDLRSLVRQTTQAVHAMIQERLTPTADYQPKRCDSCSLIDLCQPKSMRLKRGAQAWFSSHLKSDI